jgi:HK97 family phage prohead protease
MSNDLLANVQFKARSGAQVTVDKAEGIVECFVAGIGNKDSVGDIVLPGAFTESLKRRKPRVVWGHSWNDPIGKVLEIYEVPNSDPRLPQKMKSAGIGGLFAKVQFNLGAEKGREAFANVAFFGEEQEWSIGYKTLQANFDPVQQANMLKEVELYEVSPVLHGANQLTGTISVKDGEAAACGTNGCDCSVKSTAIEPEAPEGIVFEKGSMMGRMPMVMIPLPIPSPGGNSVDASNRDIWSRGEAGPIDLEDRRKLATEIHGRTKVPIKIVEATENMVVFLRKMVDGTERMYRMPYHKTDSGQYMFGKPARVKPQTVYAPDNTPNPMGHIHHKPNSGPLLAKDPNGEEFKDGAPMLIPCAVENILETKDALSPILEYYEATVTPSSGGLIITDYKPEFREAANTALKALGGKLGRGGGLGKGRRAGRALTARFDPRAWDGDNDGLVQEGTPFERPSIPGINTNLPGQPHTRQKPKESPDDHRSSPQRGMRSTADERVRPGANARRADQDSAVDMDEILDREDERTPDGLLDPTYRRRLGATPMTPRGVRSSRGDGIPDDLGDDDDYSDWLARNHEMTDETLDEMARYYDDPPNSGMRSMASGDRRKRIGELNEKLQVLDEEISRAGRFEDPDYKRMVDTENRLTTEISALRRSETLFDLESGSRSRIAAKKTLELNLTEDEIGSLRNHIQEMVKGNTDKKVNGALASYDTLLSSAKNGKIKVPVEVYDNIIDNWDKATGGKKIHPKTGRDILEFAAMSDDSKFTSTSVGRGDNHYSGFGKQRVNNGAPPEITPRMQKEMLGGMRLRRDTGQGAGDTQARLQDMSQIDMNDVLDDERSKSTPGVRGHLSFVGGHGLMANAMREDGHGSPRQWQMVRGHHGMRSSVGDQGPVKPSSLPGAKKKGGRQVGDKMPEKRLQGKKLDEVKPSNWKEMTDEEQWDFISSLRSWSKDRPDGIRQVDLDRVSKELAKKIEIRERREKRREGKFETIAERRARRLEQGVSLPEPKETPSKEPQPQTPQGAARERRETLEAMDNIFARAHSRAQKASDDDELGNEHLDFWGKTMDILSDSDDLTYSQIEALDALFEEYLGVEFENMSAPESASRRTALAQKGNIETLLEKYRGNRDIQQGDSAISERLGGADEIVDQTEVGDAVGVVGMRSMVSRNSALFSPASPVTQYVQARRPTGMRATREGRTQVNGEATFFKKVGDSLPREISEARKDDNRTTVKALELLQQILKRQESGKVGDRRSNAGTLTVTQAEVDQILEGLMDVVDRQVATDGSRTKMFVELLELLSEAAMSTFIMETTEEIHARTQRRRNSRGDQVSIPLNPS